MKLRAAVTMLVLIAAPLAAQTDAPMSYDERVTCGALLFLGSQAAEDPTAEQAFAAHHIAKAVEVSGKPQEEVVDDFGNKMTELAPAWEREDAAVMDTYTRCISVVLSELGG